MLDIRFQELREIADCFVVVEADRTFSGLPKQLVFSEHAKKLKLPLDRFEYQIHRSSQLVEDAWANEILQRNSICDALRDLHADDLVLLSDVDEIPRADLVKEANFDRRHDRFGFSQSLSYFRLNYFNISGFASRIVCSIAFRPRGMVGYSFHELRMKIRDSSLSAHIFENGGWHFSYLSDEEGIREKIRSFSHQELNTPEVMARVDVKKIIANSEDLFQRDGFDWAIGGLESLPRCVQDDPQRFSKWLI